MRFARNDHASAEDARAGRSRRVDGGASAQDIAGLQRTAGNRALVAGIAAGDKAVVSKVGAGNRAVISGISARIRGVLTDGPQLQRHPEATMPEEVGEPAAATEAATKEAAGPKSQEVEPGTGTGTGTGGAAPPARSRQAQVYEKLNTTDTGR